MLLGALWLASTAGLREPVETEAAHWKNAPAGTQWRRTAHGWQRVDRVLNSAVADRRLVAPTSLSPLVVAAMQLLISVLALSMFPPTIRSRSNSTKRVRPPRVTSQTGSRQKITVAATS